MACEGAAWRGLIVDCAQFSEVLRVLTAFRSLVLLLTSVVIAASTPLRAEENSTINGRPEIRPAAAEIDRLVEISLKNAGLEPLPPTDDTQFVRRLYLDVVGRIPTAEEVDEFVSSSEPDKRAIRISKLLRSRGYVSHSYNLWADILRIKDEDSAISRGFYIDWVKTSFEENKPYDQFVRELITASGSGWARGNGAVGYYLRDRGMPLDNMANTLRIFTGTRVACAQCHDHPNDRWTRKQFFEMAAFTNNLQTDNRDELFGQIYEREKATKDEDLRAFSQYVRNTFHADRVHGTSDGNIALPADYQYGDAKPDEKVAAHTIFGPESPVKDESTSDYRQRFGNWLTSPENPRFTVVITNRLWKRAMGRGLIEPVDDIRDDTQPSHPELMDYLSQLMRELDYDMRAYLEVLYNTETYQRQVDPQELVEGQQPSFRGRQLSRMTAEQAWDSLMTLVVSDVDAKETGFYDSKIYYCNRAVLAGQEDMYGRFEAVKDHDVDQHWEYLEIELAKMRKELADRGELPESLEGDVGRGFYPSFRSKNVMARASELRSPAEPNHFLRTFGQSNRELIEGGNNSSTVPQFLSMFNGLVEMHLLRNPEAVLTKKLVAVGTLDSKIDLVFVSILGRSPSDEERAMVTEMPAGDDAMRVNNLVWSLVNSQEFLFVQ